MKNSIVGTAIILWAREASGTASALTIPNRKDENSLENSVRNSFVCSEAGELGEWKKRTEQLKKKLNLIQKKGEPHIVNEGIHFRLFMEC